MKQYLVTYLTKVTIKDFIGKYSNMIKEKAPALLILRRLSFPN